MKKASILICLFVFAVIIGCKTHPIITNSNNTETKDSTKVVLITTTEKTAPIVDSLVLTISQLQLQNKQCDSLCEAELIRILSQINTKKTSGSNGFEANYNATKKQIVLVGKVGATTNKVATKDSISKKHKNIEKTREVPIAIPLTKEQSFNLWTGRIFWILLFLYIIKKAKEVFIPKI